LKIKTNLFLALALLTTGASQVQASIISVSGPDSSQGLPAIIISPPATTNINDSYYAQEGFDEKQGVILPRDIEYGGYGGGGSGIISEGTVVDSHFIFLNKDIDTLDFSVIQTDVVWEFSGTILGVMSSWSAYYQKRTVNLLGATGTAYPGVEVPNRGLEGDDAFVIDGNLLTLDMNAAVDFLTQLKELRTSEQAKGLPLASDACFSVVQALGSVQLRLERLLRLQARGAIKRSLHMFLEEEFKPALAVISEWSTDRIRDAGWDPQEPLPQSERTLSPSDFGFHNALLRDDGAWVFLDFDYFGWDDPAKMIADFLLHPAMQLTEGLKRRFAEGMFRGFSEFKALPERTAASYRIYGLKWCMILLNEFVPELDARRRFARGKLDREKVLGEQLEKARRMLEETLRSYERFPY